MAKIPGGTDNAILWQTINVSNSNATLGKMGTTTSKYTLHIMSYQIGPTIKMWLLLVNLLTLCTFLGLHLASKRKRTCVGYILSWDLLTKKAYPVASSWLFTYCKSSCLQHISACICDVFAVRFQTNARKRLPDGYMYLLLLSWS